MPTILDDLKLRLGAFSAIFRPATLTADRVLTLPDKAGTLLVNSDIGTIATQNVNTVAITGGAIDGTPIGATTRSTIKATTIDASGALAASAYAKISGVGGSFNGAIETQPNAYAQAHLVCLDPVSPASNPALRLIQTGLRTYQMAVSSGGGGTFTFTNLGGGGFTTTLQSNQNLTSLPLTLANVSSSIGYGTQFNFQLGDGTTLYNSGGIAYRQESAFTSAAATQNAYVTLASMTAGSATEKLRIVSAGRFLLGTVTDDGSNLMQINGGLFVAGNLRHSGSTLGFYAATAIAKPTVTGSKASGAALASLLTALSSLGLITDSTTA